MSNVFEINCATGEVVTRAMTAAEESQRLLDVQEALQAHLRVLARERIQLLRDSEWTQLRDTPLSNVQRNHWADYRQLLREMLIGIDPLPTPPAGSET